MALGPSDVQRTQLHGASVIVLRDPSFPVVQFSLALRSGALTDVAAERGAMALLLPLCLRGTKLRARADFNAALEALGSSVDTACGHEMALFGGTALKRHFAATMALLTEAICSPALAAEQLADLGEETRAQLVSERDDDDAVADLFLRQAFYGAHPLGSAAAGTVASLARLSPQSMQRALGQWASERMVVGVAGDVDMADVVASISPLLAQLSRPAPPPVATPAPEAPARPTIVLVDKPNRSQVQLRVARPGLHVSHGDSDAFWLGIMAFGGTFTSPFTREVRDVRGWSYFAHADYRRRAQFAAPVVLRSAPALEDAVACLALEQDLFDALAQGELADEAVQLARAYLQGKLPMQSATVFDLLGQAVILEVLGLPAGELWNVGARLEAVDVAQVAPTMRRHLHGVPACAVLVGPKAQLEAPLRAQFPDAHIIVPSYTQGLDG